MANHIFNPNSAPNLVSDGKIPFTVAFTDGSGDGVNIPINELVNNCVSINTPPGSNKITIHYSDSTTQEVTVDSLESIYSVYTSLLGKTLDCSYRYPTSGVSVQLKTGVTIESIDLPFTGVFNNYLISTEGDNPGFFTAEHNVRIIVVENETTPVGVFDNIQLQSADAISIKLLAKQITNTNGMIFIYAVPMYGGAA